MLRMICMTFSLVALVTIHAMANLIPFNGKTTSEINNGLPVLFTPAGYVFIIYFIIYAFLACWLYGYWKNKNTLNKSLRIRRSNLFILSCWLTILWFFLWHYSFFNWSVIVMITLLTILLIFYFTYPKRDLHFMSRMPIAVYLGWTFIATISNISYVLMYHEWTGIGLSNPLWTVIYLTFATAIALHFLYHHKDIPMNVVFIWSFIGIAVKNGSNELFVTAASIFLLTAISVMIYLTRKT